MDNNVQGIKKTMGGDFEMVLDDAQVGVDVTTAHYGGLGLLLVVS